LGKNAAAVTRPSSERAGDDDSSGAASAGASMLISMADLMPGSAVAWMLVLAGLMLALVAGSTLGLEV
jgi:hypothetical protein